MSASLEANTTGTSEICQISIASFFINPNCEISCTGLGHFTSQQTFFVGVSLFLQSSLSLCQGEVLTRIQCLIGVDNGFLLIVGELRSMFLISSTWHGLTTSSDRARLTICHICILSPKCLIDCDWTKKRSPNRYPQFVLCSFPYIKWFFFLSIIAQKCVNIFPVRQAKSKAKMFINMIWLKYLVLTE